MIFPLIIPDCHSAGVAQICTSKMCCFRPEPEPEPVQPEPVPIIEEPAASGEPAAEAEKRQAEALAQEPEGGLWLELLTLPSRSSSLSLGRSHRLVHFVVVS